MIIKIDKRKFYKVLRRYRNIEKDFFKKLEREVVRNYNNHRNKVVLKDLTELRGAYLFISISDKASIVEVTFTKKGRLRNPFIEGLIVNAKYFDLG